MLPYLPPFTELKTSLAHAGVSYRVGGPSSAGSVWDSQLPQSDAGNLELAVDFLMWMSAPQNFGEMAATYRGFIPMVKGTEGGEVVANFAAVAELPERLFGDPNGRLTVEAGDEWATAMQAFFLGQTDIPETQEILQEIWYNGMLGICEQQGYEWCP